MPAKSKKGGGGAGGSKGAAVSPFADFPPPPAELFQKHEERYVKIHVKLVTWNYLNFQIRITASTNLFIVEQKIKEHHGGSISNLQLWKDQVHPKNVLRDFAKTMAEVFQFDDSIMPPFEDDVSGGGRSAPEDHECVIFYDFSPHQTESPLLLRSPRHATADNELKEKDKKGGR
uniref:Uncharacterized protein n=1 Tax=Eutreptiella gymnastica TaxID=73025 RepID=A0A7S1IIV9_9EUGL|mmetsp:Transcript_20329/g.36303  ORF Transcript_20329/g.36303 Transcript_20329/m.36303 type:complete len:174 (+) Transcript_20329:80-601(+)